MNVFNKEKTIILIETRQELINYCQLILQETEVAIDTEFDRNRIRYGLNLCVVQIATSTHCYIIDPIKICQSDAQYQEYLAPLWEIVNSPNVVKIIYDCSEDLKVFMKYQCRPTRFFDLKVAEKVLALPSISFVTLIKHIADIDLNKNLQVTNWYKRPFSKEMVQYLANDVNFLIEVKQVLQTMLDETDRNKWFDEEMTLIISKQAKDTEDGLEKFGSSARYKQLTETEKFIAMELWKLRTEFAKKYNTPVHYVFSEDKLLQITSELKHFSTLRSWEEEKNIHRRLKEYDNAKFVKRLNDILNQSTQYIPPKNSDKTNFYPREHRTFDSDAAKIEREAFKQYMLPIQEYLEQKYDKRTQEIILSNRYVQDLFKTKRLNILKSYAINEVISAAQALQIDLSKYLKMD